jgi:hypothetical protein
MNRQKRFGLIGLFCLWLFQCGDGPVEVAGGVDEVENPHMAMVSGSVLHENGAIAKAASVKLIPVDFNPAGPDTLSPALLTATDSQGIYAFNNIAYGTYNLIARSPIDSTGFIVRSVIVNNSTQSLDEHRLMAAANLVLPFKPNVGPPLTGTALLLGTDFTTSVNTLLNPTIVLPVFAADTLPSLYVQLPTLSLPPILIGQNIRAAAGVPLGVDSLKTVGVSNLAQTPTLDGSLSEYDGLPPLFLAPGHVFTIAHTDSGIYLAATVIDSHLQASYTAPDKPLNLDDGIGCLFHVASSDVSDYTWTYRILANINEVLSIQKRTIVGGEPTWIKSIAYGNVAVSETATGYQMELFLPWSDFRLINLSRNPVWSFDCAVFDRHADNSRTESYWINEATSPPSYFKQASWATPLIME